MAGKFDRFYDVIEKGAVGTVDAVEKATTVTVKAVHKSTTVALQAAQKGTDTVQRLSDIRGRRLSVLNGVIGDMLVSHGSELAIEMELLGNVSGGKLCIMLHGLCDSEDTWLLPDDTRPCFGPRLQKDLGYAPLYVRYNSGLHISTNGQKLAQLISELCEQASKPIDEVVFIGHSMGGLLVRSACHYGEKADADWVKHVKKIIFLGTPHHGNDYEKLGNLTSSILSTIPNIFTKGIAAIGNKRSAGIKDLRFSYLLDEDWMGHDADALWKDNRHPVPLLEGADYYIIAASLAKESDNIFTQYFGDGVIPSRSAAGRSFAKEKTIPFPEDHFKTIKGLSHVGLTRSRRVYQQICEWCR